VLKNISAALSPDLLWCLASMGHGERLVLVDRKTLADLARQLSGVRAKLNNESFVSRAPAEVVAQQKAKEADLVAQRTAVSALLGEKA